MAILTLGWSILEGIGAALVLPAMAALIAGNFEGESRKGAYAIIGGVAGAGIAIGPILGGWATTELSWRVVFAGEVVLVLFILAMVRYVLDTPIAWREAPPRRRGLGPRRHRTGPGRPGHAAVEHLGLGAQPKDSPVEPFGFSMTLFVIAFGGVLLWGFVRWQRRREAHGQDPLVHLDLLKIPPLRSGLIGMLSQNLILMGIFFSIPLYLQIVLGLDALDTGIKMLPVSIAMFITSAVGSRLSARFTVRAIVRAGLWTTLGRRGRPAGHDPARRWPSGAFAGVDGPARRRDGADRLPARQRRAVLGRRLGPGRGRRPAVHRPATRVVARGRPHRRRSCSSA